MAKSRKPDDPLGVTGRLYQQVSRLLEQLESEGEPEIDVAAMQRQIETIRYQVNKALSLKTESLMRERVEEAMMIEAEAKTISLRERITALVAIGRIQMMFGILQGRDESDAEFAGSAVRKYATTFTKNDAGRRARNTRPRAPASTDIVAELLADDDE